MKYKFSAYHTKSVNNFRNPLQRACRAFRKPAKTQKNCSKSRFDPGNCSNGGHEMYRTMEKNVLCADTVFLDLLLGIKINTVS
jgi:hypothetical protein